jgi:hypothetical protein
MGAIDRPKRRSGRHTARLRRDGITARLSYGFNFLAIRVDRIDALFAIEREINGTTPQEGSSSIVDLNSTNKNLRPY